jgi:hypothetical protein
MSESDLARAERHVRQGERRVARIAMILERLNQDQLAKPHTVVAKALDTLQQTLTLARDHALRERQKR